MHAINFFKSPSTWVVIVASTFLIYACSYEPKTAKLKKPTKPEIVSSCSLKEPFTEAAIMLSPYTDHAGKILKPSDTFYVIKYYGPWAYGYDQEEYWGYVDKNKLALK